MQKQYLAVLPDMKVFPLQLPEEAGKYTGMVKR